MTQRMKNKIKSFKKKKKRTFAFYSLLLSWIIFWIIFTPILCFVFFHLFILRNSHMNCTMLIFCSVLCFSGSSFQLEIVIRLKMGFKRKEYFIFTPCKRNAKKKIFFHSVLAAKNYKTDWLQKKEPNPNKKKKKKKMKNSYWCCAHWPKTDHGDHLSILLYI